MLFLNNKKQFFLSSFFCPLFLSVCRPPVSASSEQRIVNLQNTTSGQIHYLNYPRVMPNFVDFNQRLIAPLGNVISIELQNVQFNMSSCADNATIEVSDGNDELRKLISSTFAYDALKNAQVNDLMCKDVFHEHWKMKIFLQLFLSLSSSS